MFVSLSRLEYLVKVDCNKPGDAQTTKIHTFSSLWVMITQNQNPISKKQSNNTIAKWAENIINPDLWRNG